MFARAVAPLGAAGTRLAWRIAGVAMVLHWLQGLRSAALLDTSRAEREFGWKARIGFEEGLRETIAWFEAHRGSH